jgi:hypothetical protein
MTETTEKKKTGRKKGTLMPHKWISGPCPRRHAMYKAYSQQKNQANFRKEGWTLEFDDYAELWDVLWEQRGMGAEQYCSVRIDIRLPWEKGNVTLMLRKDQLARNLK